MVSRRPFQKLFYDNAFISRTDFHTAGARSALTTPTTSTRNPWTFHTLMCVCVCVVVLLILAHRTVVCTSSLLPGTRQCFWEFKYFQRVGGSPITVYNHIQMGVRAAHVFISTDTNYYFILLHLVISLSHTHDFIIICLL